MRRGLFRLWLVASVIGVLAFAQADFNQKQRFWDGLNASITRTCVDNEFNYPDHPDALECGRKQGAFLTVFQRESTTPAAYWLNMIGAGLLIDLGVTAALALVFVIARWVWRGFRD